MRRRCCAACEGARGIGGERYDVGRRLEAELRPDVFLLDDGFQHVRLKRDEDIVLLDALDPMAAGFSHWGGGGNRCRLCAGDGGGHYAGGGGDQHGGNRGADSSL